MPKLRISPDFEMHYQIDDYTDPWLKPETVLMLHGNCESGDAWYGWVPHLARRFRVVRPDMRGFGASTPMPRDFPWTLDVIIDDFIRLMDTLGVERFHLVGAKIGGTMARGFAGRRADRVLTLTVAGTPTPHREGAEARIPALIEEYEKHGVEPWLRRTMAGRLGSAFPPAGVEWWAKFMSRTAVSSQIGWIATLACVDITAEVARIACPTLVITTENSALASVEENRAWQQQIPNSTLLVLPGDSYHVAATDPDRCAQATLEFILRHSTR